MGAHERGFQFDDLDLVTDGEIGRRTRPASHDPGPLLFALRAFEIAVHCGVNDARNGRFFQPLIALRTSWAQIHARGE